MGRLTLDTHDPTAALQMFDDQERLIRQYVVEPGKHLYWVDEHVPAEVRQMR
ncbi:MAG: hypothetical protein OXJ90_23475 [Spirochaetaceae bacterium]|nr:hypothetical protein [Spirochaetaceae bacterium]